MPEAALQRRIEELERKLHESEQLVQALRNGEIDTLAGASGAAPILLYAAQEKLRASEQLLRAVFDGATDAILIADDGGRYVDANPAACALFGVSRGALIGTRVEEFAAREDGTPTADMFMKGGRLSGAFSLLRPDGSRRDVEYRAAAAVLPGVHLSVLRDVTEANVAESALREAEQKMRLVISHAPIILFAFGRDRIYTLHEGKGVESLGLRPGECVGMPVFTRQQHTPAAEDAIQRAFAGEQTSLEFTIGDKAFDGTLVPVRDADGAVTGATGVAMDVTLRKRAESALRASEARFRAMIEKSREGITLIDAGGTVLYVSPALARIAGRPASEMTGASTFDFVHPDDRERLYGVLAAVLSDPSQAVTCEFRGIHSDGSIRWLEGTGTNLLDDPAVAAIVSNFRDITDRKLTEAALHESKRELEDAQAVAHLGSWASGATPGDPISWSAECARIFGRELGAAPTGDGLLQLVHPEDKARIIAMSESTLAQGKVCETEYRILLPTGELRWIHARWAIEGSLGWVGETAKVGPDHLGRGYRAVGVVQDITARKRSEAELRASEIRYRRIVENTSEGVWMYDASGTTTFMNPRMAEMLGCTVEEGVGQPIFAFMDEAAREEGRQRLARRQGGLSERGEFRLTRRDGSDLWVSLHANALFDSAGVFESSLTLVADITEQRKAEAAVRRSEEQLRQAQKMEAIGSLAGGVAHDFNNLLTVILSYSTLMMEELSETDPRRGDLGEIHKAGLRAAALTRQLLAFSRQQVLQPVVLDLSEVAAGVEKMLQRLLGEDIDFCVMASPEAGKVVADQGQMEQVIMNLVVNARDAMPKGGSVTIETANVDVDASYAAEHSGIAPGRYVMLAVSDTGTGMDAATRERIFEPFFTTKEKAKGTGLGLSTVYGIVKQSGGHIWVYSEPGKGTTFKVYLPRTDRAVESVTPLAQTSTLRGTETILLVEDEEQVRTIMRSILRKHGYHVLEAQSGGDAFLICEQFTAKIHMLLTDVVMPRMSGRQLAERLSRLRPAMKVLYVSGYTDDAIVHHGILDSGIEFLSKPIMPEALLRKVRLVLDARPPESEPEPERDRQVIH